MPVQSCCFSYKNYCFLAFSSPSASLDLKVPISCVSGHCDFCPAKCLLDIVVTYPFECSTHDVAPGKCRFILEISQWGSNWPPSEILGDPRPFSRKGVPQKLFELIVTDCSMRKRTLVDALPPFWNILGNWKSLGSNYCRIPDVCLVK